ncbi:MAG: hypothetical protein Q9187_004803 [Circinaria calcarea]
MVLNTITVGAAVTPTVVKTYTSHYLNRKPRRQRPTAHISYDEGLNLIRQFLHYASLHTVEEIQAFTSQWVPVPRWVKVEKVAIPEEFISKAADAIVSQLGHKGIAKVGGSTWWRWRREGTTLKAEWIEMRTDYDRRKEAGDKGNRVMLYVHGGAYFFGSTDEHRYQMQRHARKLKARVFARMLVILRDQGIPLPAGAVLISPWVDLTHSFPSVVGDNALDYIPTHGFLHRPSPAWPPPNADDMEQIALHGVEQVIGKQMPSKSTQQAWKAVTEEAVEGSSVVYNPEHTLPEENQRNPDMAEGTEARPGITAPRAGHDLAINLDGKLIQIKDQIQMYASNQLISHPLISPVLQPSLGGLPPLLILTGGGEVLRDEQIYLAHKAANPSKYPPGEAYLEEYPGARESIGKWKPTDVQLQVWDDLCHVAPTLSFTRPAKYMYRSIAQFGAWALARAQKTEIEILDDDDVSIISSGTDTSSDSSVLQKPREHNIAMQNSVAQGGAISTDRVGKAGDALPPFRSHMIRQRVDRHGTIYPLEPASSLPALKVPSHEVGVIKPGPVRKWLAAKKEWDTKFAKEKRKVQKQRAKEMAKGFQGFGDEEVPPPSALAGRRGLDMPKEEKRKRSWGMTLWSLWGNSHDEKTIQREEKADRDLETSTATEYDGANARPAHISAINPKSRSRSRRRNVTDTDQTNGSNGSVNEDTSVADILRLREQQPNYPGEPTDHSLLSPSFIPLPQSPSTASPAALATDNDFKGRVSSPERPTAGGMVSPFKLGRRLGDDGVNASTFTLESEEGVLGREGNMSAEGKRPEVERWETAKEG